MYTPLVKKSDPTTTVTGQKKISADNSANITLETTVIFNIVLSIFFSRSIDQKPCKNNRKLVKKTKDVDNNTFSLIDSIASNNKKDVTSVKTKPTPLAARNRAIVLSDDTVYIFIVDKRTYIPTVKKIIIGILVYMLAGIKNQNIPTPSVNNMGRISAERVIFLPKPSKNDQADNKAVIKTRKPIIKNLNCSSKN